MDGAVLSAAPRTYYLSLTPFSIADVCISQTLWELFAQFNIALLFYGLANEIVFPMANRRKND